MEINVLLSRYDKTKVNFTNVAEDTTSLVSIGEGDSNIEHFYVTAEINSGEFSINSYNYTSPDSEIVISLPEGRTKFNGYKLSLNGTKNSTAKIYNGIYYEALIPYKTVGDKRNINIAGNATVSSYEPAGVVSGNVSMVINNDINDVWNPKYSATQPVKAIFKFQAPINVEYVEIFGYADNNGYAPYDWKVVGSNDGVSWSLVQAITWEQNTRELNDGEVRTTGKVDVLPAIVKLDTTIPYEYYAIEFKNFNNSSLSSIPIKEIKLFEKSTTFTKLYNTTEVDAIELKFMFTETNDVSIYTSSLKEWFMEYSVNNQLFIRTEESNTENYFSSTENNLINPANFTIKNSSFVSNISGNTLFDNLTTTSLGWSTKDDYVEILINETFRIWSKTNTPLYDSALNILKLDIDGTWTTIPASVINKNRQIDVFELTTTELTPGTYRFYASSEFSTGGYQYQRTDTEWFIEKKSNFIQYNLEKIDSSSLFLKSNSTNYSVDYFNHKKPDSITLIPDIFVTESPENYTHTLNFEENIVWALDLTKNTSFYKGGNDWTAAGYDVTYVDDDKFGKCLQFANNNALSYLKVTPSSTKTYTDWTFSFWAKRKDGYQNWDASIILSVKNGTNNSEFFSQMDRLLYRIDYNHRSDSAHLRNKLNYDPNVWHHFVYTARKGYHTDDNEASQPVEFIDFYIDGVLIIEYANFTSSPLTVSDINFGRYIGSGHQFAGGSIKDIVFYNRAFTTEDEIKLLMDNNLVYNTQPKEYQVANSYNNETNILTYNLEACDTKQLLIEYDEYKISKLDINFKSSKTSYAETQEFEDISANSTVNMVSDKNISKYEIEIEKSIIDLENLEIIGSDTIRSTTDINTFLIVDFKVMDIITKSENNGVFTYTFKNDTHIPQNVKCITDDLLVQRLVSDNEINLTNLTMMIKNTSINLEPLTYKFESSNKSQPWLGFKPIIEVKTSEIGGYKYVSPNEFISTDNLDINQIVVNNKNDMFKIIATQPFESATRYIVEAYPNNNETINIEALIIRDETTHLDMSDWSLKQLRLMNNSSIHHLSSKQKNTITFDVEPDVTGITVSLRYYSLDRWEDNLDDKGYIKINGIEKWSSKRNGNVVLENYNTPEENWWTSAWGWWSVYRSNANLTRINTTATNASGWTKFTEGEDLGFFVDTYSHWEGGIYYIRSNWSSWWSNWSTRTIPVTEIRYYDLKYYKDITITLSAEEVASLGGKLTIDVGIKHHADQTLGSGGFSHFKVVYSRNDSANNLRKIPLNEYSVKNHKNETKTFNMNTISLIEPAYPNATLHFDTIDMIGEFYDLTVNRTKYDSFIKARLETKTKSSKHRSCLDILRSGYSKGDGVYTINPTGKENISVYCDMTTDGGGWTLVGKGREGWVWDNNQQGTFGEIANNSNSTTVAHMSAELVDLITDKNLDSLEDGVRFDRPDLSGQRFFWKFVNDKNFTWEFPEGKLIDVYYNGNKVDINLQYSYDGHLSTADHYLVSKLNNDCTRVFTSTYVLHNHATGFSTGSSCTTGYVAGSEGHAIARTKVWVRK